MSDRDSYTVPPKPRSSERCERSRFSSSAVQPARSRWGSAATPGWCLSSPGLRFRVCTGTRRTASGGRFTALSTRPARSAR